MHEPISGRGLFLSKGIAHLEQFCSFCNIGGSLTHIIKHLDYCWELAVKKLNYIPFPPKKETNKLQLYSFWVSASSPVMIHNRGIFFTLSLYKFEACGETADRLDQVVRAGLPGTDSNSRSSGIITEFYKPITFKGDGCQNQFWLLNQSQLIYLFHSQFKVNRFRKQVAAGCPYTEKPRLGIRPTTHMAL